MPFTKYNFKQLTPALYTGAAEQQLHERRHTMINHKDVHILTKSTHGQK